MNRFRTLLAGGLMALGIGCGLVWAQSISGLISGNECWNAGQGPGGPSTGYMCANLVRNTTGYQVLSTPSGTIQMTTAGSTVLVTGQPGVSTWVLPQSPVPDGQIAVVANVSAANWATNAQTLTPGTGQTLNGGNVTLTSLVSLTSVEFHYSLATNTWYRTQ
jgi:hypothetical protein